MSEVSAKRMGKSSLYTAIFQLWKMGSRFILTPLIIAQIGLEGYGTWTLLFGLCSYVSMFHTSFGSAYVKYTAELDRLKQYDELSRIVSSGMFVMFGLVGTVLFGLWFLRAPVFGALNVPDALASEAGIALALVASSVLVQMSVGGVEYVLFGLQRVDVSHRILLVASAVDFAVAIPALMMGYGLVGLAAANLVGMVFGTVVGWITVRRICPGLRLSPLLISSEGLRSVVGLGGRFQMLSFVITGFNVGRKALISALSGVEALAVFELAEKLVRLAATADGAVVVPMMPAFANLHAGDNLARVKELHTQATRVVAAVAAVAYGYVALFAGEIIHMWTGEAYPLAAWTLRWMCFIHFINGLGGIVTASMRGRGMVRLETQSKVGEALSFAVLAVPMHALFGYEGIVMALVVGSPWPLWLIWRFARQEGISAYEHFWAGALRATAAAVPALGVFLALHLWVGAIDAGRVTMLLGLAAWGLSFLAVAFASLWFVFMTETEKRFVIDVVRRARPSSA